MTRSEVSVSNIELQIERLWEFVQIHAYKIILSVVFLILLLLAGGWYYVQHQNHQMAQADLFYKSYKAHFGNSLDSSKQDLTDDIDSFPYNAMQAMLLYDKHAQAQDKQALLKLLGDGAELGKNAGHNEISGFFQIRQAILELGKIPLGDFVQEYHYLADDDFVFHYTGREILAMALIALEDYNQAASLLEKTIYDLDVPEAIRVRAEQMHGYIAQFIQVDKKVSSTS